MTHSFQVQVELFGALRRFSDSGQVVLNLLGNRSHTTTVAAIRTEISKKISQNELLRSSVFADERRVLHESDLIENGAKLALLPPVCGG